METNRQLIIEDPVSNNRYTFTLNEEDYNRAQEGMYCSNSITPSY